MFRKSVSLGLLLLCASIQAQVEPAINESTQVIHSDNIDITLTPSAFYLFGKTEYNFELTVPTVDTNGQPVSLTIRSLLEFPLDVFMLGGSFGLVSPENAPKFWSVEGSFFTNLNDPGKVMKDSDWLRVPGYFNGMISYTESDAKMDLILINAEATREMFSIGNFDVGILAGFRYQKIKQNIIGYEGWSIDSNLMFQTQSGTDPAIVYKVTYQGPQLGALSRFSLSSRLRVDIKTAASLTFVNDLDDHLLRKFQTSSDGQGLGIISYLSARWFLNQMPGGRQTYLDFVGSYDYYKADLTSTQYQYADGGPYEMPVGTRTGGLPHDISSHQFRLGLRLGFLFQ